MHNARQVKHAAQVLRRQNRVILLAVAQQHRVKAGQQADVRHLPLRRVFGGVVHPPVDPDFPRVELLQPRFHLRLRHAEKVRRIPQRRRAVVREVTPRQRQFCFRRVYRRKRRAQTVRFLLLHLRTNHAQERQFANHATPAVENHLLFVRRHPRRLTCLPQPLARIVPRRDFLHNQPRKRLLALRRQRAAALRHPRIPRRTAHVLRRPLLMDVQRQIAFWNQVERPAQRPRFQQTGKIAAARPALQGEERIAEDLCLCAA